MEAPNLNDTAYSQISLSPPQQNPGEVIRDLNSNAESAILSGTSHTPTPDNQGNQTEILPQYYSNLSQENPSDYFCFRNGLIETAIKDCISTLVFPNEDGNVVGSWLLTEISLWDNEKERIVILTKKAVIIIKYDFIALKKLEYRRILLSGVDTVVLGELMYPKASIVPRLNGIASGLSSVMHQFTVSQFSATNVSSVNRFEKEASETNKLFDSDNFKSRDRHMNGVRIMWNKGQPLPFMKKWNPFDSQIPFNTFTFHPLFFHKDVNNKGLYDINTFGSNLVSVVQDESVSCDINHNPIMLSTYVGLSSFVHNKTALGFFKVRGKFSF